MASSWSFEVTLFWRLLALLICTTEYVVSFGLVLALSILVIIRIKQRTSYSKTLAFPHRMEKIPLIRHAVLHLSLQRTAKDFGVDYSVLFLNVMLGEMRHFRESGIFTVYMGSTPNVIIYRADHVEKVLTNSINIRKAQMYDLLMPWLGEGLLTSTGRKWKTRRRMLTPAFHFQILNQFSAIMNERAKAFVDQMGQKKPNEDIVPYVSAVTLDIVCETIMGVSLDCQSTGAGKKYLDSIKALGEQFFRRVQSPAKWIKFIYYLTEEGRKNAKNLSELHKFTMEVIEERKRELEESPEELERMSVNEESMFKSKKPFLDVLLVEHLRNKSLSLSDIREEVDTFMFEGHDTTSMGITWAIYLLGLHPEVQEKIFAEILRVFDGDLSCSITADHLKEMKYLEMALKETQRIYPSVPMIARSLTNEIKLLGKPVPEGSEIVLNIVGLHSDPKVFHKPEIFDPERFSQENSVGRSPFAFVPFSAGPRNCIGQRFALLEEKIILISLIRKFKLKSLDQRDNIHMVAEMVLRPKSTIRVHCIPRL